ncbi:hypothetical protein NHH03_17650 [Stieleria sp. TO1_6]|uniref:hypothetical protein n=1 Tax=Stieleria tagensis TaxID=2956795 RepID=UPI00209B79A9|nr:hypothetical protein [Stieleria tagensis]MCO8123574.1 hypothetical protein [Stieleria tagensis]
MRKNSGSRCAMLVTIVTLLVTAGCQKQAPGLSGPQVDQILDVQQTIVDEQTGLNQGRDDLESDRRQWAQRDRRDPIIAESIQSAAILIACCLPLAMLTLLLWPQPRQDGEQAANEVLVEMLTPDCQHLRDDSSDRERHKLPDV